MKFNWKLNILRTPALLSSAGLLTLISHSAKGWKQAYETFFWGSVPDPDSDPLRYIFRQLPRSSEPLGRAIGLNDGDPQKSPDITLQLAGQVAPGHVPWLSIPLSGRR